MRKNNDNATRNKVEQSHAVKDGAEDDIAELIMLLTDAIKQS